MNATDSTKIIQILEKHRYRNIRTNLFLLSHKDDTISHWFVLKEVPTSLLWEWEIVSKPEIYAIDGMGEPIIIEALTDNKKIYDRLGIYNIILNESNEPWEDFLDIKLK